jgi:transposase
LRDLRRTRATLTQDHSSICNRIQKVLEDGNIKLACVASDVFGASGRAMVQALMNGESDAQVLAELSKGRLRAKLSQLQRALDGRVTGHHRFLLHQHWEQLKLLEDQIREFDQEIARRMHATQEELGLVESLGEGAPMAISSRDAAIGLWMELPGVGRTAASVMVAELGVNMEQFPTSGDMASWAALCPGNNDSAGKRKSGRTRKGNVWLRRTMSEVAWAASHTTDTYFAAQFRRIASRRGKKRALIAVAHSILVAAYYMLKYKRHYQELGGDFFDVLNKDQVKRRLVQRLGKLGFEVTLTASKAS